MFLFLCEAQRQKHIFKGSGCFTPQTFAWKLDFNYWMTEQSFQEVTFKHGAGHPITFQQTPVDLQEVAFCLQDLQLMHHWFCFLLLSSMFSQFSDFHCVPWELHSASNKNWNTIEITTHRVKGATSRSLWLYLYKSGLISNLQSTVLN